MTKKKYIQFFEYQLNYRFPKNDEKGKEREKKKKWEERGNFDEKLHVELESNVA